MFFSLIGGLQDLSRPLKQSVSNPFFSVCVMLLSDEFFFFLPFSMFNVLNKNWILGKPFVPDPVRIEL